MLKLETALAFVAIAEAGSITAGARRLQISKSVASERLAELERSLGTTLMHRTTRKLTLTEDGIAFHERAKRILREVDDAESEVSERRGELVGPLRISAPVSFGIRHLGPAICSFLKQNARIEPTLELDDRFVNVADGFDAVVRHGPVPDNGLIVKRLASSKRMLVASQAYLKKNGVPKNIADLERHSGIIYSLRGASDWRTAAKCALRNEVVLVEHGRHRLDLLQCRLQPGQHFLVQHRGVHSGLVDVILEDVPAGKHHVLQIRASAPGLDERRWSGVDCDYRVAP